MTWVCSPQRYARELRTDVLFGLDGVPWIVDHMRLTWDERVVPWIMEDRKYLEPSIDEMARSTNVGIALQCPRIGRASRKLRGQQLDEVLGWPRSAADYRGP